MKKKIFPIFLWIGFVIAVSILVYPSVMDAYYRIDQTTMIGGYEEEVSRLDPSQVNDIKQKAIAYNEKIAEEQSLHVFMYQGANYKDEEYDSILRFSKTSKVMASIEIPGLNIYLPITHGTYSDDLEYQAGHMRGTSVPIGGPSTHAVIAGHTGLQNADIFTNVVKMKQGDEIRIHVLNEIHVYKVIEINVVLPGEETPYLQIEPGRDLITLYTCTPYGINDHRLLVKAERSYPDIENTTDQSGESTTTKNTNLKAIFRMCLFILIPILVLIIGAVLIFKKKKTKKEKKKKKTATQEIPQENQTEIKIENKQKSQKASENVRKEKETETGGKNQ